MNSNYQDFTKAVRKLSQGPARLLNRVTGGRLTPNMVSIAGVILTIPVAWLISQCYLGYGGLLLLLIAPIDMLDGALARVQKKSTNFGVVLDATLDRLKEVLIFAGLAYHFSGTDNRRAILAVVLALGLSLIVSYTKAKGEAVYASNKHFVSSTKLNRKFASGIFSYEVRVILLAIGLIFSNPEPVLWLIVAGATLTALTRLININKQL